MGNLLSLIINCRDSPAEELFVDFESCQPTESELVVWNKVNALLVQTVDILSCLQAYTGATSYIRAAMMNPNDTQAQVDAWEALLPLVAQLKRFYMFSLQLNNVVPALLYELCNDSMTPQEHLETQQALFKQCAQLIDFTMQFDSLKIELPAIQNDFSYYRRRLSVMKLTPEEETHMEVNSTLANHMTLFYANTTPMLKTLSDITSGFVSEHKEIPVENTTDSLNAMARVCRVMIQNRDLLARFRSEETVWFCIRVMVGVIILYDHVHPLGAFCKASNIDVKSSIRLLRNQDPERSKPLIDALRYTTRHLNSDTTPKSIRSLLQE